MQVLPAPWLETHTYNSESAEALVFTPTACQLVILALHVLRCITMYTTDIAPKC